MSTVIREPQEMPSERGVSQYQRLASLFRHRIVSGQYPMGSRLPAITQLANELGVAVVSVRQAYELLASEKLISSLRGRGTHVTGVPEPISNQIQSSINDPFHSSKELSFEVIKVEPDVPLPLELRSESKAFEHYVCVKKLHLLSGEPFCYGEIYVPAEEYKALPRDIAKKKKLLVVLHERSGNIFHLIRQRTSVAPADFPLCELLKVPFASPVARMSRRVVSKDSRVLYGSIVWYRGDRYVSEAEFPARYLDAVPGIAEAHSR